MARMDMGRRNRKRRDDESDDFSFLSRGTALAGLLAAVTIASPSLMAAEPTPDRPPNIIFMLADDLGYGDLSSYNPESKGEAPNNTPIRTPALDSMAKNGMRSDGFPLAAPLCSPSRRALLSAVMRVDWANGLKLTAGRPTGWSRPGNRRSACG